MDRLLLQRGQRDAELRVREWRMRADLCPLAYGLLLAYAHGAPCGLTLDMSGDWKRAKHAGRRPLDGRVRRLYH